MKNSLLLVISVLICSCSSLKKKEPDNTAEKIRVLNFGTAHLSYTTDANSTARDLNDRKVKEEISSLVTCLKSFKPTIICVEMKPHDNSFVNEVYQKYIIDQSNRLNYSDELNSIAFETGRLSGVKYIYGIDYENDFDYPSLVKLANRNKSDSLAVANTINSYKIVNALPLYEQFYKINTKEYKMETFEFYNFLATMHTTEKQEGVDVIADFYKRNLKMYVNFCDIPATKNDRVLVILGATHTAYFDVFLEHSNKYKLENVFDYIKEKP